MSTLPKELAQNALDANRTLHYLLTRQAERLKAELQEVDRLLGFATDEDVEEEAEPDIQIPGAKKASAPFPAYELLKPESPFFEDAKRRAQHVTNVTYRPMKARELEVLADAIQSEKMRLQALQDKERSQALGLNGCIDVENDELDWKIIAEKVSDVSAYTRSAEECRIKWVGELMPQVNKDEWSTEEVSNLKNIISDCQEAREGGLDWALIAHKLGTNRTPIDCLKHGTQRSRHTWSTESDQKLLEAVEKYGVDNWAIVARTVSEHVTTAQCQSRYAKTLDPLIKRGLWSEAEDNRLRKAVAVHGNAWTEVARCITGRTNDQCRERWSEQLNVSARGEWKKEDDDALREAHKLMGNQWKAISQRLGIGKTDSQCRIRLARLKKQDENATLKASKNSQTPRQRPKARVIKKIKAGQQQETDNDVQPTQTNTPVDGPVASPRPSRCGTPKTSTCIESSDLGQTCNQSVGSDTDPAQVGEKRLGSPLPDVTAPKKPRTTETVGRSYPQRIGNPVVPKNLNALSGNEKQRKRSTKRSVTVAADIPEPSRRSARVAARSAGE